MNLLDSFDDFLSGWIEDLQRPEPDRGGGYTGATCPYAKIAQKNKKIKTVKVHDYFESYEFWSVVAQECETFDDKNDIVVIAAMKKPNIISQENISGAVDALNTVMNVQKKDVWLLWGSPNQGLGALYTIVLLQHLTATDDASKVLEEKGYYVNRLSPNHYSHLVTERKKMRDLL